MNNENNYTNGNGTAAEVLPVNLEAHVRPIAPKGNLLAFANVRINGCFVVEDLKVCSGDNGLFVNMPSAQDGSGKWHNVFFPITTEARQQIETAVLEGYTAALEKMQAALDASRAQLSNGNKEERPSVRGQMKDTAKETKEPKAPAKAPREASAARGGEM